MNDREQEIAGWYKSALNLGRTQGKIKDSAYLHLSMMPLDTFDQIEIATLELIHFLKNSEYYDLLDRIEKGEALLVAETDPAKQKFYRELLAVRYAELEALTPKEEAA